MPVIKDKKTDLTIIDTDKIPFGKDRPDLSEVADALKPMILSASGWRKVFAASGDEESREAGLTGADKVLAGAMAFVFAPFLKKQSGKNSPVVTIAMDSRPTGPALADILTRVFLALGVEVQYHFISAAPEAMAWAGRSGRTDGFAYISASHNPVGHNGIKFGLNTGGVLDGQQSAELISRFKDVLSSEEQIEDIMELADTADRDLLEKTCNQSSYWKKESYGNYKIFTDRVISGSDDPDEQQKILEAISAAAEKSPVGIIAEHNGSARSLSIDKEYLESLNILVKTLNDKPGLFVHRIVPEGFSLDLCREELEKAHSENPAYQLGYVPDCDGDRGNLVYIDESGEAKILEAQEVFALSVLAELAFQEWTGLSSGKTAVSVNGPTSLRIEAIAGKFGAEVHRAEVGEANVVNLAVSLREKGYNVPILGEGSNGGNITYPAAVRDPLNTAGAMLKLLSLKTVEEKPGLFEIWCRKSGQMDKFVRNCTLSDIIKTLPVYTTTSAFEDQAIMRIKTESHGELKKRYEENFPREWESRRSELNKRLGITSWEEINNEGIHSRTGVGPQYRSGAEKGGLKILFRNKAGDAVSYIWMRGSGTEPVFRVLADVKGNNREMEQYLLNWQREMIALADKD
ncbi:phosphoglucomutase [Spirochaeta isovalerica]|uniref:Phosphomannomutase n=1 Tax=Spirochaeta isovalerica TaxID=150 RepID=A0A841RDJ8_9SPIO|nr:phosphoglucomutase [Spirochaeta isovalerica]MBB6481070.1 phosphomannomutase [Spirochaeta isovalerica]